MTKPPCVVISCTLGTAGPWNQGKAACKETVAFVDCSLSDYTRLEQATQTTACSKPQAGTSPCLHAPDDKHIMHVSLSQGRPLCCKTKDEQSSASLDVPVQ